MARESRSKFGLGGFPGLLLALLVLQGGVEVAVAEPREWPVGDSNGWNFGVLGWPNFKPFKEGDVLRTCPSACPPFRPPFRFLGWSIWLFFTCVNTKAYCR